MSVLKLLAGAWLGATMVAAAWPGTGSEAPEWRVREEIRIGAGAGIERLAQVSKLVAGRDGRIHVLTATDELIAFDRSGRLVHRRSVLSEERRDSILRATALASARRMLDERARGPIGPGGYDVRSGPGYDDVRSDSSRALGWVGDSLWVALRGTGTIALIGQDGRVARESAYSPAVDGNPANFPVSVLVDRSLLRTISWRASTPRAREHSVPPPPESFRMPVVPGPPNRQEDDADRGFLVRASADGKVIQALEIFTEPQLPVVVRNPYGSGVQLEVPFQDHPLIAVTPDGAQVIFVERYRPPRVGPTHYSVVRYNVATGERSVRRHSYVPRSITRATVDSLLTLILDAPGAWVTDRFRYGFPSLPAAKAAIEAALEIPAHHPPVIDLVAGADHGVWIREHGASPWTVLDRDGAVAGTVTLPPGVRLLYADAETAWGVMNPRGPDRSAVLVRYRLLKP